MQVCRDRIFLINVADCAAIKNFERVFKRYSRVNQINKHKLKMQPLSNSTPVCLYLHQADTVDPVSQSQLSRCTVDCVQIYRSSPTPRHARLSIN